VVDELEERYPAFNGLNLSFETREGILKHCSRRNAEALSAREPQGVAQRFLDNTRPSLEAQLCNLADEIAYNAHDIDDGVRSGLLSWSQLHDLELVERYRRQTLGEHPALQGRRLLYETIRRMLSDQVYDVINATKAAIAQAGANSLDAVRVAPALVCFSPDMREQSRELKRFLFANLYRHPQVMHTTDQARQVVRDLFDAYLKNPTEMQADFARREDTPRAVADYIAGMTDRFAAREHARLTGQQVLA
jgi:dGTPase